jgi:DNA-binding LytR/AlgR family response regulator
MRVVIADDEPVARERLALAVSCVPDAELVGSAASGAQALALVEELKPDVAVLDIEMPRGSGLKVLEALLALPAPPEVIFVTAYADHALQAFDLNAVDYLLKPVAFERFREALRRADARLRARTSDERFLALQRLLTALQQDPTDTPAPQEFWVRDGDGLSRLPAADVRVIRAEGDYVRLEDVRGGSHLIKDRLRDIETRLDASTFLRIHRSTIVNIQHVRRLDRKAARDLSLTLSDGRRLAIGPLYAAGVLERLNAPRWRGP